MENRTFNSHGTFSAITDAKAWLEENGYSVGSMCRNEPIGFKKGDWNIQKWYNLSREDRELLDGTLQSEDFREGDVTVSFKVNA